MVLATKKKNGPPIMEGWGGLCEQVPASIAAIRRPRLTNNIALRSGKIKNNAGSVS